MCAMRGEFGSDGKLDVGEILYRPWGKQGIVEVGWDGVGRTYTCWTCYRAGTRPHTLRYLPSNRD